MKRLIIILVLLAPGILYAQVPDTLELMECHKLAISSFPIADRTDLLNAASEIRQKRLNANYLPQVQVNGQASYQSDVTRVDVEVPPFYIPPPIDMQVTPSPLETPVPPNDQYKITMDVLQVIYDGGITAKQKKIDISSYELEKQQVEVELHKLKENINQVFFNTIIIQENEKLLAVLLSELNNKLKDIQTAIDNGVALSSDADVLKAEIIRVEQQIDESHIQKEIFIKMLAELISQELSPGIILSLPQNQVNSNSLQPSRPELQMFNTQHMMLDDTKDLITSTWMPKLSGFGQLGYGNPGLNFMEDKWTPYYIVGARLKWQIWNWNQNKKDKQILGLRQDIVDKNKETFDKNLTIELEQHLGDIRKYEQLINKDFEVIILRKNCLLYTSPSPRDHG